MTLREQFDQRRKQWEAFDRWEREQVPAERAPSDILADLGAIWDWLPEDVRTKDPDPGKKGIQSMHEALGRLPFRP
jgi:hypothetical protein